jgi:glycosyltransferase involved in cell wall biosynthesis
MSMFVSVIMPAYNAERFLAEAIESVLDQTHTNFELFLVNDGSTDQTLEIMRHYEALDSRIRVLSQENQGAGAARNHAIELSSADWIAFMDADDVMEPYRLARQIAFVQHHPDLAVTSNCVTFIDDHGKVLGRSQPRLTTDAEVAEARERDVVIGFHHTLVDKAFMQGVGCFRQEYWPAEDTDLWTRIADAGGRILVQPEHLTRYRIHDQSTAVKQARSVQRYLNWVMQSSLNRRAGLPEPSYEEFMEQRRGQPFYRRINDERKDLAIVLYKQARFAYSTRRFIRAAALVAVSAILSPVHTPAQVWQKVLLPKFSGRMGSGYQTMSQSQG